MSAGLFGKLPAKRDFVAANAARRFLEVWEPWLQAGVATSRQMLGDELERGLQPRADLALLAGRGLLRRGDDRRFHALDRRRRPIVPARRFRRRRRGVSPAAGTRTERRVVRSGRGDSARRARPGRDARGRRRQGRCSMPAPALLPRSAVVAGFRELPEGGVVVRNVDRQISLAFLAARRFGHRRAFASQSFWWTIGGEGFPPVALSAVGLPPPDSIRRHADRRLRRRRAGRSEGGDMTKRLRVSDGVRHRCRSGARAQRGQCSRPAGHRALGGRRRHGRTWRRRRRERRRRRRAEDRRRRAPPPRACSPNSKPKIAARQRRSARAGPGARGAILGTTLVALMVHGTHFACVWCGDSRVYLRRNGKLAQISRDHSEVQELIDRGVLRKEEAKTWPRRNVVTRALGATDEPELEIVDGPAYARRPVPCCAATG